MLFELKIRGCIEEVISDSHKKELLLTFYDSSCEVYAKGGCSYFGALRTIQSSDSFGAYMAILEDAKGMRLINDVQFNDLIDEVLYEFGVVGVLE
jgi:hypothetical protein